MKSGRASASDIAFRRLMQRVWHDDVVPLLRGKYAKQRASGARIGGKAAAGFGFALDRLLGFKGKPFQRSLGVLGTTLGAVVPDVWDATWLRQGADDSDRRTIAEQVHQGAAGLELSAAAELLELGDMNDREALREAWRNQAKRWHPDVAPPARREEHRLRFVACQAAYDRISKAFENGELPRV